MTHHGFAAAEVNLRLISNGLTITAVTIKFWTEGRKTRFFVLLDFLKDMGDEVYVNPYIYFVDAEGRSPIA